MALIDDLFPASYKGAEFLINSAAIKGGRKDVLHSFPQSDKQNIEDLGLLPRNFTLPAIINEPDYINKRDTLLRALEEGGAGVLIHPSFGRIENIFARSFTGNEDFTRLGDTTFTIVFDVSDTDGLPTQASTGVSEVSQNSDIVNRGIEIDIGSIFSVTNSFPRNFLSAQLQQLRIIDTLLNNVRSLTATPVQINSFNAKVVDYNSNINSLITEPTELAAVMSSVFLDIPGLYTEPKEQVTVLSQFFVFGDDDEPINQTTAGRIERKRNQDIINDSVKGFSLTQSYVSAAQINFSTVEEIEDTANILETGFQSVKSAGALSTETLGNLEDLRTITQRLFDEQKLTANQIINVNTQKLPSRVIAYQYYGESDLGNNIALLNNSINVSGISGDIDILTA